MTNQVTYLFFHGMKQISENLFTTEEQAIIARSKAEGSYMKAPNGQATNLNEKQWAQTYPGIQGVVRGLGKQSE